MNIFRILIVLTLAMANAFSADAPRPAAPDKSAIAPAKIPLTIPDGPGKAAWEALIKNDFAAAEKGFKSAIDANPNDLDSLEGLRWTVTALGRYRDAQNVNLRMVKAAAQDGRAHNFILRCIDTLPYVESRAELIDEFSKLIPASVPHVAVHLRDQISQLHYRAGRYDEARKMLEGLGYIGQWVFAAGPFGENDKNNIIERRFAPERALTSLDFKNEKGEPIKVVRDPVNFDRDLDLDAAFEGTRGVYYVMANLKSAADCDAVLAITAPQPWRVFLRGLPVASQPDDEPFSRSGGYLVSVRLIKGNNPLLFKLGSWGGLTVRACGPDLGPLPGVVATGLSNEQLAKVETSSERGFIFGTKATGSAAIWFLSKYAKPEDGVPGLRKIVESAPLTVPEAIWLQLVLWRENDHVSNEILARRLVGSFPDCVAALDLGALMLGTAGRGLGNTEARESEEARRWRERALKLVPDSHQHLIALTDFFVNNELRDQAFELARKCAAAHPDSPLAQAELARLYLQKNFYVEAERCYEKAASLDASQIPALTEFHRLHGNRTRVRELQRKQLELGMLNVDAQYNVALHAEDFGEAARLLDLEEKWFPERKEFIAGSRAQLLQAKGDLQGAYEIRKKLFEARASRKSPNKYLNPLIDLSLRLNRIDEAKKLLSDHLAKHANDLDARRRLDDLEVSGEKHWWEAYDVNVSDVDTSHFTAEKYPSANHAWIVDFMVVKILPDLSTESYTHIAQKVLNLKGIGEISEVMTRAKSHDIVFIRTLNPDGSTYMPQNVHDFHLEQSASLYKVGPGSILERAYVERTPADENEPILHSAFNFNAIDAPRAVSRWVVMIADGAKEKLDIQRIRPELLEEKMLNGPPGYTVYQWTNKQVEGIKGERFMAREIDREIVPMVQIETRNNPVRAAGVLTGRELDRIPEAAKAIARDIAKAAAENPASKGRVPEFQFEAILLWVRGHIETGTDSRTLDDAWHNRSGNASQMLALAREMARAAGLNVSTAYVNGSYLPGKAWLSKSAKRPWEPAQLAAFGTGGQMLVLEPPRGLDIWAQFNPIRRVKYYSPFDLLPQQPGALALILGDRGARVTRVQGQQLGQVQFREKSVVNLADNGVATIHTDFQLFGAQAGAIRETLSNPQQREPVRDFITRRTWRNVKALTYDIIGEEEIGQPLLFKFTGRVSPLAEQAGGALYLPAFSDAPRVLELRGQSSRESEMVIRDEAMLSEFDRAMEYNAPEGFAWTEVPDDIFLCTEFGFYVVDFNVKGRTLYCTRACLIPAQRISTEKYSSFQNFVAQIAQHHVQRIACAPIKAESFGGKKREVFSGGYATSKE